MINLTQKNDLNKIFIFISIIFFVLSRLIIIYMYEIHLSDVKFYHIFAELGIIDGYTAYKDFFFPYPPLALPLVYLPIKFSTSFEGYRLAFQFEMLIFDVLCLVFTIIFAKQRLKLNQIQIGVIVLLYSILGMFIGQLLYDRLDIVIAMIIMAMIFFYTNRKVLKITFYLLALIGSLIKLVPFFLVPVSIIIDFWNNKNKNEIKTGYSPWSIIKRRLSNLFIPLIIFFIPFFSILIIYDLRIDGSLFRHLLQHGERGIQIESVWATPLFLKYLFSSSKNLNIVTIYGAQHIHESSVSSLYIFVSKYLGFFCLLLFYLFYFYFYRRLTQKNPRYKIEPDFYFLTLFTILIFILASQRVLSPQFFIWVIPGFCLFIVLSSKRIFYSFLTLIIYTLTFIGFDNYWEFFYLKTPYIIVVLFRNVFLIIFCFVVFCSLIRRMYEQLSSCD